MAWNNGKEMKKFKEQQKRLREQYLANGMTEEQIAVLYQFDLEQLNSRRRECEHTQPFDFEAFEGEADEGQNPLYDKFLEILSITDDYSSLDRYGWIEEIEDVKILKAVKTLSKEEIEIVTMLAFEDMNQSEIATSFGLSQQSISKKIKKIKEIFQKWL